jgi:hypothetical protein
MCIQDRSPATIAEVNLQPSPRECQDFLASQSKESSIQKKMPPPPVKFQRKSNTNSAIRSAGISQADCIPAMDIQPFLHAQRRHVQNLILESDIPAVEMHSEEQEAELLLLEHVLNFSMA